MVNKKIKNIYIQIIKILIMIILHVNMKIRKIIIIKKIMKINLNFKIKNNNKILIKNKKI